METQTAKMQILAPFNKKTRDHNKIGAAQRIDMAMYHWLTLYGQSNDCNTVEQAGVAIWESCHNILFETGEER